MLNGGVPETFSKLPLPKYKLKASSRLENNANLNGSTLPKSLLSGEESRDGSDKKNHERKKRPQSIVKQIIDLDKKVPKNQGS